MRDDLRPRLIYLASIGRSGTTLLERLLDAHDDISSMGELHLWPHEIRATGRTLPCGCGRAMTTCEHWEAVRRHADPLAAPAPRLDAFREHHTGGRTLRIRRMPDFLTKGATRDPERIDRYGANTEQVVRAFLTQERQEGRDPIWAVDSSKDPYRLAWLVASERFDLRVLHVVRDPRGFVASEHSNHPTSGAALLRLAARKGAAWSVQNALSARLGAQLGPSRYLLVRYEDLAQHPAATLERIGGMLDLRLGPELIERFGHHRSHAIGGNPMRHRDGPIALDERWRADLPVAAQRVALLAAGVNRRAFGY